MAALSALTPPVFAIAAAQDYALPAREVGVFTALLFLGAMGSAVAGGAVVARFGAIRTSQACLVMCAAGVALTASGSAALGALGGLVAGIGYGPMTPASSHLLAKVTTARSRPFVFSLKQTSVPIGGALAGLIVPALVAAAGWRGAALGVAGLVLLVAGGLQIVRAELDADRRIDPLPRPRALVAPLGAALREPALRELGLVSFVFSAMQLCLGTFLVTYLVEALGYGLAAAGVLLTVSQTAGIAGRVLWGALAGRVVAARPLLGWLGLGMAAAAAATGFFSPSWPELAVALVAAAFGATAVGWNGIYLAEIVRVTSPERSGSATGGVLFFTFAGMTAGPAFFGALAAATGSFRVAFWAVALMTVPAGAALLIGRRRGGG